MSEDHPIEPKVEGLLAQGRKLLEERRFDEAEQLYGRLAEHRPQRWEGHLGLAHIAFARGDYGRCFRHLPMAIRADPECLPAYELMAELGTFGGVSDTAIEWLELGAQHLPREPRLFEWLVRLYAVEQRTGDLQSCLVHYGLLRNMSPSEAALLFSRDPTLPEDIRSRIARAGY